VRVYLPTTLAGLRAALDAGEVPAGTGYAVTPALREWYVEGDLEQLEYAAGAAAARASLRLLTDADADRRVVLAAEVPDAAVGPSPHSGLLRDRAAVALVAPVPLRLVDAGLVDDPAAVEDVRRARSVLLAADTGDDDAAFVVASLEDHELGWYAAQELPALVALEADPT
jgi:hypothetical protein